jgi:hypothetical protein
MYQIVIRIAVRTAEKTLVFRQGKLFRPKFKVRV